MFRFFPVEWHDSLPSTNTYLMERVKRNPKTPHGTVIAAREQTAGRGRQQRSWLTAPNENITVSFLWNAPVPFEFVPSLAQAISVGIGSYLQQHVTPAIKWPNDVLVGGKKISGILCERVERGDPECVALVAGIGLNVNMGAEHAARIDQPVTSLALERGARFDTVAVLDALLAALSTPLNNWSTEGFPGIRDAYTRLGAPGGTPLSIRDGEVHVSGTLVGYDSLGALMLALPTGEIRTFYSGDVTRDLVGES